MKDPSDALGKSIFWVNGNFDLEKKKMTGLFPVLNGKVLNVNVLGTFGGAVSPS
jgi:hypothetical protein